MKWPVTEVADLLGQPEHPDLASRAADGSLTAARPRPHLAAGRELHPADVRTRLRRVQPCYWRAFTKLNYPEIAVTKRYEDSAREHPLCQLARLSNIDEHRRLARRRHGPGCATSLPTKQAEPTPSRPWVRSHGSMVPSLLGSAERVDDRAR